MEEIREDGRPGAARLVSDALREARTLVRLEAELAAAELARAASEAGRGALSLALGAGALLAGAFCVVAALGVGLAALFNLRMPIGIASWLGPLVAGLLAGAAGGALLAAGLRKFQPRRWVPRETLSTLREHREWIKREMTP